MGALDGTPCFTYGLQKGVNFFVFALIKIVFSSGFIIST